MDVSAALFAIDRATGQIMTKGTRWTSRTTTAIRNTRSRQGDRPGRRTSGGGQLQSQTANSAEITV